MAKVNLTYEYLKDLYAASVRNDTLKHWAPIALEWAEHAEAEITRLEGLLKEATDG